MSKMWLEHVLTQTDPSALSVKHRKGCCFCSCTTAGLGAIPLLQGIPAGMEITCRPGPGTFERPMTQTAVWQAL